MITKINNKVLAGVFALLFPLSSLFFTSCEKFFEQDSDDVLYADKDHLNNAVDTVYSVVGIMNKLQAIADRTILLGEVRGDLIDLTSTASSDLRDLATFNVGDDNVYNAPRDYYAVINNCNYFIANANTALKSNRDEFIFMKEYAAVKAIRAWTYLQLVINYGRVPFVTEPVLSKEDAERQYEMYDIEAVCRYFLNDLASIPELYNTSYPAYRTIRSTDSRYFFFPLSIIRGELNLWLGSVTQNKEFYRQAALNYYKYISQRNGTGTAYPIGLSLKMWRPGSSSWTATQSVNINEAFNAESESSSNYTTKELITMIPGDSIRAEGNYSELRNLFNSTEDNQYKPSLTPSQAIQDISAAQVNCCLSTVRSDGSVSVAYAPQGLSKRSEGYAFNTVSSELVETQSILKYQTRNVHIYRRQMVYLRMAEALNQAGYPRMAFQMLAQGVNNKVKNDTIYKFYSENDSLFLAQFDFPETLYGLFTVSDVVSSTFLASHNTIGIHTRGSGWTPRNEHYVMPDDTTITNPEARLARQIAGVDSLILNESALEFAFEGTRYYDVMRYAMRQSNPGEAMAKIIYGRRGESRRAEMQGTIKKDLNNKANWFLNWNGKIGF